MIVDMVRNDLGRIAETGSVDASAALFDVEKYPTVWQMTSTVTRGRPTRALRSSSAATFPPASITGAPKARTMEIIAELETAPRGDLHGRDRLRGPGRPGAVQRGDPHGAGSTCAGGQATYGVGGGIVWDSRPDLELEECRTKARILSRRQPSSSCWRRCCWTPQGGFALLDRHLTRLTAIGGLLLLRDGRCDRPRRTRSHRAHAATRPHRIRLLVDRRGGVRAEASPIVETDPTAARRLCLASAPVDESDPFLYHKTTNRAVYEAALASAGDCDDVILWNRRREVTETCIANLVIELEGRLVTPPVTSGLLPGTYRAQMLAERRVREEVVSIDALGTAPRVWLVNSVRGEVPASIVRREHADRDHA